LGRPPVAEPQQDLREVGRLHRVGELGSQLLKVRLGAVGGGIGGHAPFLNLFATGLKGTTTPTHHGLVQRRAKNRLCRKLCGLKATTIPTNPEPAARLIVVNPFPA
jgi:hypothetical protein